jgi:hypothetical protein
MTAFVQYVLAEFRLNQSSNRTEIPFESKKPPNKGEPDIDAAEI